MPIGVLILLGILTSIFIMESCRKIDHEIKPGKFETASDIVKKFFTVPASADEKVKAIARSIERQNKQRNFIEGLVKRVGYPHWDEAMIASKKNNNARPGEDGDSSSIIYIPFSKPDSNTTAAALAVGLNYFPTDTLYHMLYPNQYKQYSFDTTNTDGWNARTVFHLFAELDYQMFGQSLIEVTDGRILGGEFEDTKVIKRLAEQTGRLNDGQRTADLVPIQVCAKYGPYWAARIRPGNRTNAGEIYFTFCNTFWVDDPDDPGPLSLPGGNGTGGSGNGGAGYSTQTSGHWDTIPPCPEESGRVHKIYPQTLQCSFIGWQYIWVPSPGSYNPYIYDTVGIAPALETAFPCLFAFLKDSLPNANLLAQLAGAGVFKDSAYMHLTFDTSIDNTQYGHDVATTVSDSARVESDGFTHFKATIKFNSWYLRNATTEFMISTIIHEAMHAIFKLRWSQYLEWRQYGPPNDIDSNFIKDHYPIYWNNYVVDGVPLGEIDEHLIMATDYQNLFHSLVASFYNPAAPQALRDSVIKAMNYGGLDKTTAWKLLPSQGIDTCKYKNIIHTAAASLIGIFNSGGTCSNFTAHYADSLKLRPNCN